MRYDTVSAKKQGAPEEVVACSVPLGKSSCAKELPFHCNVLYYPLFFHALLLHMIFASTEGSVFICPNQCPTSQIVGPLGLPRSPDSLSMRERVPITKFLKLGGRANRATIGLLDESTGLKWIPYPRMT